MLKPLGIAFSVFVFLSTLFTTTFAQVNPSASPTIDTEVEELDSFELFWPLVAGKSQGDSMYFLKSAKEKLRGFFIFGLPQKVDYNVFLVEKRLLEVEKLLKEGKPDLAKKTLDNAEANLDVANSNLEKLKSSGQNLGNKSEEVAKNLTKIDNFAKWLATQNDEQRAELENLSKKASELLEKL